MAKLMLIMGDLATGKTTFAKKLSQRYGVNVFSKDSIKEVLGDTVGFSNREENLKLSKAAMELMLSIFSEFCKLGKSLILEANFHAAELAEFAELADNYGYDVLTLMLRGDVNILHKRFLNRIQNENRHPVHLSVALDDTGDFAACIEHSRSEHIEGDILTIDANDFSYQEDAGVLSKIDGFFN